MGSTLTNTQPKDTYKSLLKTSDSSELSATAKYVSDGNGNDSKLALSTSKVGINTTLPNTTLEVKGIGGFLDSDLPDTGIRVGANANYYWQISRENIYDGYLAFIEKDNGTPVERLRFTQSSAGSYLRLAAGTGGIQFGGDSASANALDDYEEGTYTVSFNPQGSGTITLNPSYTTWTYTKIGRSVTIRGIAVISSVSSPTGGVTYITLPFTNQNANGAYTSAKIDYYNSAASPTFSTKSGYIAPNQSQIIFQVAPATIAAGHEIYVSVTYFV